jgi:hypothetical protein
VEAKSVTMRNVPAVVEGSIKIIFALGQLKQANFPNAENVAKLFSASKIRLTPFLQFVIAYLFSAMGLDKSTMNNYTRCYTQGDRKHDANGQRKEN